jgi:hypothetical protein
MGIFTDTPRRKQPAAERRFQTFPPSTWSGKVRPEAAVGAMELTPLTGWRKQYGTAIDRLLAIERHVSSAGDHQTSFGRFRGHLIALISRPPKLTIA